MTQETRFENATPQRVQERIHELERDFEKRPIQEGRMAAICAVHNASDVLPATVKGLLDHAGESSLNGLDIILVLDNGGGNSSEAIDALCELGVPITVTSGEKGLSYPNTHGDRIVILNHKGLRGKPYALGHALDRIIEDPHYHPEWAMVFDAETRLHAKKPEDPALNSLIKQSVVVDGIVSAEARLAYFENGVPRLREQLQHPILATSNVKYQLPGNNELVGGCILGRFSQLIALYQTNYETIPGNPAEDYLIQLFCDRLGIPYRTNHSVFFTNRVYRLPRRAQEQVERWVLSSQRIREFLGPEFSHPLSRLEKVRYVFSLRFPDLKSLFRYLRLYARSRPVVKSIHKKDDGTYQLTGSWDTGQQPIVRVPPE